MQRLAIVGLVKIELPGGTVIRLTDGGVIKWGSEVFSASDATYGAIGSVESLEEGIGNSVPAAKLILNVPNTTAAATLVAPGMQTARVRLWQAEYDVATNLVTGTPDLGFDGFLDQPTLTRDASGLTLEMEIVSRLERMLELNIGNSLNPTFHKSIWPGETGEDHATGLALPDAWGVEAPPSAAAAYVGVGGGGSGGANLPALGGAAWR